MTEEELIKEYLKNPKITKLFYSEFRFDLEAIKSEDEDKILNEFGINYLYLTTNQDFLEKFYLYEDKKIFYNEKLKILIIYTKENFLVLSLNKKTLEELIKNVEDSKLNKFIIKSEIKTLENHSFLFELPYPFFLEEFIKSKETLTTDFYDKLSMVINAFKRGLKNNGGLKHYFSYILMCSLLEELFAIISNKEEVILNGNYNIANCIRKFMEERWLIISYPRNKDSQEDLKILSKEINNKKIFCKNNHEEGLKIKKLLDELNNIRKKYIHFTSQKPNNPSDNLIGLINFGQFLIWCEENEYL
jgi:hypothetical protein